MSSQFLLKRAFSQGLANKRAVCSSLPAMARVPALSTYRPLTQTHMFSKKMSTNSASVSGLEAAQVKVLNKSNLAVREILLNDPKKFNALNLDTVRAIVPLLQAWEKSELAKIILMKHSGGKAFCTGGDIKYIMESIEKDSSEALSLFEEEYQLNHLIGTIETPYVAIIDGLTTGAGVAMSTLGPFCIATENTVVAMPEASIGLFPDVGGSFFLSRLDGQLGVYFGLTGKQLKGVDVLYSGIASHYVPSSRLADLEARLAELDNPTHNMINQAIEEYSAELSTESAYSLGGSVRQSIDRCFKYDTVEEIVQALEKEEQSEWKEETLKALSSVSPTSLKIALLQIRSGSTLSLSQCLKMDFHLAQKVLQGHDFKEGTDATLIRQSKANWNPSKLEDVDLAKIKQDYFDSPSPLRLELLNKRDFKMFPHRKYWLPSEKDIMRVVTGEAADVGNYALNRQQIVDYLLRERQGKQGVKEKVLEVLDRKTIENKKDSEKSLKWVYEV